VDGYHQARLGELIEYIAVAIDRYRAGEVDAYTVDETIHHYHRAARELWKFCWSGGGTHIEMISHVLDRMTADGETINWGGNRSRHDSRTDPSPECRRADHVGIRSGRGVVAVVEFFGDPDLDNDK